MSSWMVLAGVVVVSVTIEKFRVQHDPNGEDDDGDGLIDFPDDPGCAGDDRDETTLRFHLRVPTGGRRRWGERLSLDFGCQSAADDDEVDVCGQASASDLPCGNVPSILLDTSTGSNNHGFLYPRCWSGKLTTREPPTRSLHLASTTLRPSRRPIFMCARLAVLLVMNWAVTQAVETIKSWYSSARAAAQGTLYLR